MNLTPLVDLLFLLFIVMVNSNSATINTDITKESVIINYSSETESFKYLKLKNDGKSSEEKEITKEQLESFCLEDNKTVYLIGDDEINRDILIKARSNFDKKCHISAILK